MMRETRVRRTERSMKPPQSGPFGKLRAGEHNARAASRQWRREGKVKSRDIEHGFSDCGRPWGCLGPRGISRFIMTYSYFFLSMSRIDISRFSRKLWKEND